MSDPFADDVLERLVQSNHHYQQSHGHYIVPLAQRLLDARAALAEAERERDDEIMLRFEWEKERARLRALLDEFEAPLLP